MTITGRATLTGGYVADTVTRVDLDRPVEPHASERERWEVADPARRDHGRTLSVVVKRASAAEVAAMRALAVVRGVARPRLIAAGPDWLVVPYYAGPALAQGPDVPEEVWTTLARVHAHWLGRRPRGLPVLDAQAWRHLCVERILPHVLAAGLRSPDPVFVEAAASLRAWADDPRVAAALAVLPRTLVHGDAHRGNILLSTEGPVLIDWGNAKVGPPGMDLPVLRAQGATDDSPYHRAFTELAGPRPPELVAVETEFAELRAHVGYLGFAADHLGPTRVAELVDGAARAQSALGPALHRLTS